MTWYWMATRMVKNTCGGRVAAAKRRSASAAAAAHSHAISLSATRTLSLDFVSQAISICWRRIETVVAMLSTNGIKQFKPGRAIVLNAPQVSMIFTLLVRTAYKGQHAMVRCVGIRVSTQK